MKTRKYIIIFLVLIAPLIYVLSCNRQGNPDTGNIITFKKQLSAYKLFQGEIKALNPAVGVELLELSSTLFTDYAEKQRLIRMPAGKKLILKGNGLPIFPEGTLLAKTFYYQYEAGSRKQIIETRLLILANSKWNVATYKWNKDQTEAFLMDDVATVLLKVKSPDGIQRHVGYQIPSRRDCISCHHSDNSILPIGPKARNLNRSVEREGKQVNQLAYLMKKGLIEDTEIAHLENLPNYRDNHLPIEQRARAYMDINCGHCHQSGGDAGRTTVNLDYSTNLDFSGIKINKNNIIIRTNTLGEYHMPKLGTTVIDKEGVELIKAYILSMQ